MKAKQSFTKIGGLFKSASKKISQRVHTFRINNAGKVSKHDYKYAPQASQAFKKVEQARLDRIHRLKTLKQGAKGYPGQVNSINKQIKTLKKGKVDNQQQFKANRYKEYENAFKQLGHDEQFVKDATSFLNSPKFKSKVPNSVHRVFTKFVKDPNAVTAEKLQHAVFQKSNSGPREAYNQFFKNIGKYGAISLAFGPVIDSLNDKDREVTS